LHPGSRHGIGLPEIPLEIAYIHAAGIRQRSGCCVISPTGEIWQHVDPAGLSG